MDRRNFFKIIAGVAAAPFVAKLPVAEAAIGRGALFSEPPIGEFISIDTVQRAKEALTRQGVKGPYICIVHPDAERDLRDIAARERWKNAYRKERIAQKKLVRLAGNEIGRIDSVRFILSRSVA